MLQNFRHVFSALIAAGVCLGAGSAAYASENQLYSCGSNGISMSIEIEPETGSATLDSPRGREKLIIENDGVWRDVTQELQFMPDRTPPMLWMGPEQFECQPAQFGGQQTHASGAVGGNETPLNIQGRSLGGKLRNGPGTNFSAAGSLAEGDPITIIANTGVNFNGFDWFEIRTSRGATAYQWGGIMCSIGQIVAGIFEQCAENGQSAQAGGGSGGFMAFAVGPDGRFGHGKAATRRQAEAYALQYCGADCEIDDVTTAQCHALATVPGGFWYGAGPSPSAAENYALNFCRTAGASGCKIEYSICQ